MSEQQDVMSCEEFQSRLQQLIESGVRLYSHPHLKVCDPCRKFLIDLERIAEESRSQGGAN
jgi:hypothetical protein